MTTNEFAERFVSLADAHRDALPKKNYSLRVRNNKILMSMLDELKERDDAQDIISIIFSNTSSIADTWIMNYFRARNMHVDMIRAHMEAKKNA